MTAAAAATEMEMRTAEWRKAKTILRPNDNIEVVTAAVIGVTGKEG